MTRRSSLPGAAELFRPTSLVGNGREPAPAAMPARPAVPARPAAPERGGGSPRQRHDGKITVYVSDEELLALEHARLGLRAEHGLAVDRGRIVREAVAVLLADFAEHGADSLLVRRLRAEAGPEPQR